MDDVNNGTPGIYGSNSPFQKGQQHGGGQWGLGQGGGQTLTRSHSQQFMPLNQNPLGERRYLPSHLRVLAPVLLQWL